MAAVRDCIGTCGCFLGFSCQNPAEDIALIEHADSSCSGPVRSECLSRGTHENEAKLFFQPTGGAVGCADVEVASLKRVYLACTWHRPTHVLVF